MALVRLYQNYLSQDLPDKKYSYIDFTDRGPREQLHGYYAGNMGNSVYIWTLSGLKRFTHRQQTSVYYYDDLCGAIAELLKLKESGESANKLQREPVYTLNIAEWREQVKRGDYVWVKRVGEGAESRVIDKVWASNNYNYPYGGLTASGCEGR